MSTSRSPIPHYLANTAATLGAFITLNNVYAAWNPRGALNMLGFPVPTTSSEQKLVFGMTRMFATTRVVLGASSLAMWYYGSWKALGVSNILGVLMAVNDGFVSQSIIGKGEWGHWGAAPVGLAIGVGLLLA